MERPGVENQGYKRLFGHPTGRYYDSAKRFEVHFIWLMRRMEGDCECVLCSGKKAPVVRRSDAFRLDRTMLGRPESRTQSRDVARVRRDDSSMLPLCLVRIQELTRAPVGGRSKSATGLASERGKRHRRRLIPDDSPLQARVSVYTLILLHCQRSASPRLPNLPCLWTKKAQKMSTKGRSRNSTNSSTKRSRTR